MIAISPPSSPADHPDRLAQCFDALRGGLQALSKTAIEAGWTENEIAAFLGQLSGSAADLRGMDAGLRRPSQEIAGASKISSILDEVHAGDKAAVADAITHAFWTGLPRIMKVRRLQADGSYHWTETRIEPPQYRPGSVDRLHGASLEFDKASTDDESTDQALTSSPETEEEARRAIEIIEGMFGSTWIVDPEGRATYLSILAQKHLERTIGELNSWMDAGYTVWKPHTHPDDYDDLAAAWTRSLTTGEHFYFEHRVLTPTGYTWARSAGRPIRDGQGAITAWCGTSIDIDVLKSTEAALLERERELSQIVNMVPSHLWQLAPDGEPTFFNQRMIDFLGFDVSDRASAGFQGLSSIIEAIHPDDGAHFEEALSRSLQTGEHFAMNYRLRRADGIYRWMSSRAEPMRDQDKRIVQWYGFCQEIDDQVRSLEELRLAQENLARASQLASLSELSASIAHEIGQPLAALLSSSDACQRWLMSDPPNVERAMLTAQRIKGSAKSAADVVNRIRALFKQSEEERVSAEINDIIAEAKELIAEEASRRRVRLDFHVAADLPHVTIDRVQVQQVLVNLIRNGMDAMEKEAGDRVLQLRGYQTDGAIQLEIRDRGPGIEFPEKIFEPFFSTKKQGMGMGLAICRSIVEAHGGRLWAENEAPHGARFLFTLPI